MAPRISKKADAKAQSDGSTRNAAKNSKPAGSSEANKAKAVKMTKPLTEFTLFPKLPVELRRKIVKHALPVPTTIYIKPSLVVIMATEQYKVLFYISSRPRQYSRVTDLLLVNQEFRSIYKTELPLVLELGKGTGGRIHFSNDDMIYLEDFEGKLTLPGFLPAIGRHAWTDEVNKLAVDAYALKEDPFRSMIHDFSFIGNWKKVLHQFPKLMVIKAVLEDENLGHDDSESDAVGDIDSETDVKARWEMHLEELAEKLNYSRAIEISLM